MKKILIVDDSIDELQFLEELLKHYGYSVVTSTSGQDALSTLKSYTFDLILTDLQMEDGDGVWLIKNIRNFSQSLKVIVLSADKTADEKMLKSIGVQAFMSKPYLPQALLKLIKEHL